MTNIHKIIIVIAMFVLLVNFLFPPYIGYFVSKGDNFKIFIGYHYFFKSPRHEHVFLFYAAVSNLMREKALDELEPSSGDRIHHLFSIYKHGGYKFSTYIDLHRFYLQLLAIAILTSLALLVTAKNIKPRIHVFHHYRNKSNNSHK